MTDYIIVKQQPIIKTVSIISPVSQKVVSVGIQGPKGPAGVPGATYLHTQSAPSNVWTINHNLNKYPSITVMDTAKTVIFCEINHVSVNQSLVIVNPSLSGMATCN